jgi:hypothetical protein
MRSKKSDQIPSEEWDKSLTATLLPITLGGWMPPLVADTGFLKKTHGPSGPKEKEFECPV